MKTTRELKTKLDPFLQNWILLQLLCSLLKVQDNCRLFWNTSLRKLNRGTGKGFKFSTTFSFSKLKRKKQKSNNEENQKLNIYESN